MQVGKTIITRGFFSYRIVDRGSGWVLEVASIEAANRRVSFPGQAEKTWVRMEMDADATDILSALITLE